MVNVFAVVLVSNARPADWHRMLAGHVLERYYNRDAASSCSWYAMADLKFPCTRSGTMRASGRLTGIKACRRAKLLLKGLHCTRLLNGMVLQAVCCICHVLQ